MGGPPHEDGEALARKRHGSRLRPSIGTRNGSVEEPLGPASHSGHNCDHRLLVLIRGVRVVNHQALSSFIWSVADLLRGDYKQSDYGKVILPFTVLRRLDCVLEATKAAVLAEFAAKRKAGLNPDPFLLRTCGQSFYNTSPMDVGKLMGDQDHIRENLFATSSNDLISLPRSRNWPRAACSTR
jgi:hypothetical protein